MDSKLDSQSIVCGFDSYEKHLILLSGIYAKIRK